MTIAEALRASKARFEAGEFDVPAVLAHPVRSAPSYHRRSGKGPWVRWDPKWTYKLSADDMIADDWEPSRP